MKLPEQSRNTHTSALGGFAAAALRAMEKGDQANGTADSGDGSRRLLRYCRAAKRFGFVGDAGVQIVRQRLQVVPLPKEYTDKQIKKRLEDADVETGEACEDESLPPWEKPTKKASPKPFALAVITPYPTRPSAV